MARRGRGGSSRSSGGDRVAVRFSPREYYIDRRLWHPDKRNDAVPVTSGVFRGSSRLVVRSPKVVARKSSYFERSRNDPFVSWMVGFAVPEFVSVCLRRKERKQVLHAKRKTGKGSGFSFRRRNLLSDIVC